MGLYCVLLVVCISLASSSLVIQDVRRTIDLTTNVARHSIEITFGNAVEKSFYLVVPKDNATQLAGIDAKYGEKDLSVEKVAKPAAFDNTDVDYFQVNLEGKLPADAVVVIDQTFTNCLEPFPREVAQKTNQFTIYWDNLYFLSPYKVESQTTIFKFASETVESYTKEESSSVAADKLTYGEFKDVAAFSHKLIHVHFQNNSPFLRTDSLKRTLQISAWGVLQVEERYNLKHVGALLKGVFSRLELQRYPAPSSVAMVTAALPADATEIYFRDDIGNISTSTVRVGGSVDAGKIEVDFTQRFPMFGGWKTDFYFGYNYPLGQVVNGDGAIIFTPTYTFTFPIASPLKNMHVVDLETEIILPEGANIMSITVGGNAVGHTESNTQTYLDTTGRPTARFHSNNIVSPDNSDDIVVTYKYSKVSMLQEPLLLTTAFFGFFIATMLFMRIF